MLARSAAVTFKDNIPTSKLVAGGSMRGAASPLSVTSRLHERVTVCVSEIWPPFPAQIRALSLRIGALTGL
jgi:hypothetical protein